MWWPAIGGIAIGLGGLVEPRALGVGYDVICSGYTLSGLPADGERVTLRVFTHATENRIALFGFVGTVALAKFLLRGEVIEP